MPKRHYLVLFEDTAGRILADHIWAYNIAQAKTFLRMRAVEQGVQIRQIIAVSAGGNNGQLN
jgi:hypothetical protein